MEDEKRPGGVLPGRFCRVDHNLKNFVKNDEKNCETFLIYSIF
jgi:hypothetical protein